MSYSFTARGENKQAALLAVETEMVKVVEQQPVHALDAEAVLATASAFAGLLPDDSAQDVRIVVSGYVSWTGLNGSPEQSFTGASVNVNAGLAARDAA